MSSSQATKTVKRTTKKATGAKTAPVTQTQALAETVKTAVETPAVEAKKERKQTVRREVTTETVQAAFGEIIDSLKAEIEKIGADKAAGGKGGRPRGAGVKFLQSTNKKLRTLQADVVRISRPRRQQRKPANSNSSSGIMRQVDWIPEFLAFAGKPAGTQMSRVDATRILCDYIAGVRRDAQGNPVQGFIDGDKSKPFPAYKGTPVSVASLQNPNERKQIQADAALKKLFDQDTFSYTRLQQLLPKILVKPAPAPATA